jgi:hypothetical protein
MESPSKPILIRCQKHGAALALVATAEGKMLVVCPVCGSGADSENVIEKYSGLINGVLSEEELIDLRKQIDIAGKGQS